MGYAKEKAKIESKVKRYKILCVFIVVTVLIGFCIFGFFIPPATWQYYFSLPSIETRQAGELRVHFLSVGQGDSTILEFPDGKVMLVDGGTNEKESVGTIMRYLNALKIKKIDMLVLSHADSDHCGSLKEVVQYKQVEKAFLPHADLTDNEHYAALLTELSKQNVPCEYTSRVSTFVFNTPYEIFCLYPYMTENGSAETPAESTDNDYSSVLYIKYSGLGILLTGDVSAGTEARLICDDKLGAFDRDGFRLLDGVDILKVSHHGSKNSSSEEFLSYIGVETAVISCGKDNPYSHPHQETLSRLSKVEAKTYRTDLNGSVCITLNQKCEYFVKTENEKTKE